MSETLRYVIIILLCFVAGIMIGGMGLLKGVNISPQTWTKFGVAVAVASLGGYFWWMRK